MKSYFSSEFFTANRRQLRERLKTDAPIVIAANGLLQRGGDSSYAFSQDANFWYLTGINEPDILLVMDGNDEYLIVPSRSGVRETFDGAVSAKQLTQRSGIRPVFAEAEGRAKLEAKIKRLKKVVSVVPPPAFVEQYGLYTNPARNILQIKLQSISSGLEVIDAGQTLARMRMIKQPPELKAIQAAIDITVDSIRAATKLNKLSKYKYEYELEAEIRSGFRRSGAAGDSFEPIVAGGKNACTLHNVANNSELKQGELLLTDVGAEVEHYAADITRTFSRAEPSARQLAVYKAVLEVQQFAINKLKPGIFPKDYEQLVEHFMGEKLRELKLIKDNTRENVRKYYPHSTSHFLGLNVHDVGDYTQPLEPGIVITAEPGIYIPEESIGVRIEDDVLITNNGSKVLSAGLSKDL